MSKESLYDILTVYDWQTNIIIPDNLRLGIRNYIENRERYSYARSASLKTALQNTYINHCANHWGYIYLLALCSLFTENPIRIQEYYKTISSEENTSLTPSDLTTNLLSLNTAYTNIHIVMIPKGKSYARQVLDNYEMIQSKRLKQYEYLCIENTSHFLRIYKGIPGVDPNDIVIYTDQASVDFLQTIGVLLPNLLDITVKPIPEDLSEEIRTELEQKNQKITLLRDFFAKLYAIQYNNTEISTDTLYESLEALANLFDFQARNLSSFTENLANARNTKAGAYYKQQIQSLIGNINTWESNLTDAYAEKANYEHALLAIQTTNKDETKQLLEIIKASKYIEIISTTDTELVMRVTAPLQYFSTPDFETLENNQRSYLNLGCNNKQIKNVLHKIFVTREYKILMQALVTLEINNSAYSSSPLKIKGRASSISELTELPNPHLQYFDCWSKAKTEINKHINEGAYDLCVLQIIAAVQTVNVAENMTFINHTLSDMMNNNHDITDKITIIDKDNNKLTWAEALAKETTYTQTVIEETPINPEENTENEVN